MILGSFNFGDLVYIDSAEGIKQLDVYAHELTHYTISQNSMMGMLMLALKQVSEQRDTRLQSILKEMHNASLITQEMTAMYAQYMIHLVIHEGVIAAEYEKEFKKSDYYKKYCLKEFDVLVNNPLYEQDGLLSLLRLAIIAMNIDYTEVDEVCWTDPKTLRKTIMGDPLQYNPDFRYRRLIQTWMQQMENSDQLDVEKIVMASGILYTKADYVNVSEMISRLCRQLSEQCGLIFSDLFGGVIQMRSKEEISKAFDTEQISQRIIPRALNSNVRFPATGISLLNNVVQTVIVALHDRRIENLGIRADGRKIDMLVLHHSAAGWHYPVLAVRKVSAQYIAQFPGEIISFYEDFEAFRSEVFPFAEKRVFYFFDGQWQQFVKCVHGINMRHLYIHQVNENIYCIFATNRGRDVCFTIQSSVTLRYIFDSIDNGDFIYVNPAEKQAVDGIFYQTNWDWCRYEDVIATILNINMVDNPNGFLEIGRRVII